MQSTHLPRFTSLADLEDMVLPTTAECEEQLRLLARAVSTYLKGTLNRYGFSQVCCVVFQDW